MMKTIWLRGGLVIVGLVLASVLTTVVLARAAPLHWLAFVARQGDSTDLYVMRADGHGLRRLATDVAPFTTVAWSPDGEWIAFTRQNDRHGVYRIRVDGGAEEQLSTRYAYDVAWSPDGAWLAYVAGDRNRGHANLYRVRADGRDEQPVTDLHLHVIQTPAWSPDSAQIAFIATDCGGSCSPVSGGNLYLTNADGTGDLRLLAGDGRGFMHSTNRQPVWLDDETLLFASARQHTTYQLYRLRLAGGALERLTQDTRRSVLHFSLLANETLLVKNDTIYFNYGYFWVSLAAEAETPVFPGQAYNVPRIFVDPSVSMPLAAPYTSFALLTGVKVNPQVNEQFMFVVLENGRYHRLLQQPFRYIFRSAWSPSPDGPS